MKEKENLFKELNQLTINDSEKINVDDFTKLNLITYNNFYTILNEELKQNFKFSESEFVTYLIVNNEFFTKLGITKNNLMDLNISDSSKDWIKLIFDLKDRVFNK